MVSLRSRLRAFAHDTRGAAPIELAIGAVILVAISFLCFDLYSRVKADTAGVRMAVTMAEYISRDAAPDGNELSALGTFLYTHELGVPADLVYVLTALRQPTGDPPLRSRSCGRTTASASIGTRKPPRPSPTNSRRTAPAT